MQAHYCAQAPLHPDPPYTGGMGRKLTKPRPRQGAKLASLRQQAGLSQAELARLVGEKQQTIAYWEQRKTPPRADVVPKLARVLRVPIEELLSDKPLDAPPRRNPVGKMENLFAEVSKLPRRQQDKVAEFVSAFIEQYKRKAS